MKYLEMTGGEFFTEKFKVEMDKLWKEMNLSAETESFVREGWQNVWSGKGNDFVDRYFGPYDPVNGYLNAFRILDQDTDRDSVREKMLEIVKKAPRITRFHVCMDKFDINSSKKFLEEIIKAVRKKFPDCEMGCWD